MKTPTTLRQTERRAAAARPLCASGYFAGSEQQQHTLIVNSDSEKPMRP